MNRSDDAARPLTPRPAATVVLIREASAGTSPGEDQGGPDAGVEVFLMRRHSAMHFAPQVMVFPGGGVDRRDRGARIETIGPDSQWWARRFGINADLADALVCAAVRETFEESGVLFAGPAEDPQTVVDDASAYSTARRALAAGELSFAEFLAGENLVLRTDLLRPWANWVTPESERTRRYDTYFFVAALPPGQRADGDNTESDRAEWTTPEAALDDFAAGRSLLLPPTWTQLDSLVGHTVAETLGVERRIEPVEPDLRQDGDNWVLEFFDSQRYTQAIRNRPGGMPSGWPQ